MTLEEIAKLGQYLESFIKEHEHARKRSPVEFSDRDLDEACAALELEGAGEPTTVARAPNPLDKAAGNHLTQATITIITDNLKHQGEIEEYIDGRSVDDARFPEHLRGCFQNVYNKFAGDPENPLRGDRLFAGVVRELTEKPHRQKYKAAIEALLVHYFARCEVFPDIDTRRFA